MDGEKKKKRKREAREEKTDTNAEQTLESKKEKKKRRKDALTTSTNGANLSLPVTSGASTSTGSSPASAATPLEVKQFLEKHSIAIHTPPGISPTVPVLSFAQLDIPSELSLSFKDFKEPTPIQACTWPPALVGLDVVGIAETGRQVSYF